MTRTYNSRIEYALNETRRPISHMLRKNDVFGKALGTALAAVSPLTFTTAYIDSFMGLEKTNGVYIERDV